MKFVVGLCVGTIAFLHFVLAVPDPEVVRRYNAEEVPELSIMSEGINITYKLINKTEDLVEGNEKQKRNAFSILSGWERNPVLLEGTTLFPKKYNIEHYLVRLDSKGGYGNRNGRYGNFQLSINGLAGNKSSIGSVQIAKALVQKQPRILIELMALSVSKVLTVFVNPSSLF